MLSQCNACELRNLITNVPLPTIKIGNNINTLFVADRPSSEEDLQQLPFSDRHSKFLLKLINQVYDSYAITYMTKCYNHFYPKPYKREADICINLWLLPEIKELKIINVITLGEIAYTKLIKPVAKKKFADALRKNVIINGVNYIPFYSASYFFARNKFETELFIRSLENIRRYNV